MRVMWIFPHFVFLKLCSFSDCVCVCVCLSVNLRLNVTHQWCEVDEEHTKTVSCKELSLVLQGGPSRLMEHQTQRLPSNYLYHLTQLSAFSLVARNIGWHNARSGY